MVYGSDGPASYVCLSNVYLGVDIVKIGTEPSPTSAALFPCSTSSSSTIVMMGGGLGEGGDGDHLSTS